MALVLIGPPGAGKTTVAPLVAQRLDLPWRDTDAEVSARLGMPVADVFTELGEDRFRAEERAVVADALAGPACVLALGGGALADPDNQAALAGHEVVWLDVEVAQAARRSGLDVARPVGLGNVRGMFLRMLKERNPGYQAAASRRVDTSQLSPEQVADAVVAGRD